MTPLELATQELERCRHLLTDVDSELRTGSVSTNTHARLIVETVCITGLIHGLENLTALQDVNAALEALLDRQT
jgi:hypothetical protein